MFDIALLDCPWPYSGSPTKMGAAGKEYKLMTAEDIYRLPVKSLLNKRAVVFSWATSPKMDLAVKAIEAWGLRWIGISHNWIKTKQDGTPMRACGVRPTVTKPTTEYLIVATNVKSGRPLPLLTEAQCQNIFEPRGKHSQKPLVFYDLIEELYGPDTKKIELFARQQHPGWTALGDEIDGLDIFDAIAQLKGNPQ